VRAVERRNGAAVERGLPRARAADVALEDQPVSRSSTRTLAVSAAGPPGLSTGRLVRNQIDAVVALAMAVEAAEQPAPTVEPLGFL
jgi:hypothetical protein